MKPNRKSPDQKLQDVRQPLRSDDIGDAFPNDPLEFAVLCVALVGVMGGIGALVYLMKLNGAV